MPAAETVSVPVPEFFKVTVCEPVVFTVTLPNATGEGEIVSTGAGAATPVPESDIVAGEPAALLVIERVPEKAVAEVGLKLTVKVPV